MEHTLTFCLAYNSMGVLIIQKRKLVLLFKIGSHSVLRFKSSFCVFVLFFRNYAVYALFLFFSPLVAPPKYYSIKYYYLLVLKFSKRDTAVVAAPDGTIYLVEISSGNALWSFASGSSIYSSYQALHHHEGGESNNATDEGDLHDREGERKNATTEGDDFFIDVGEDWQLYVHGNGLKKVVS